MGKKQYEELSMKMLLWETEDILTASGDIDNVTEEQWSDGNGDYGKDWYW